MDFFNAFEREAALMSSVEMQDAFSRLLAGEIIQPGKFSTKIIKTLGNFDSNIAQLFQKFCSIYSLPSLEYVRMSAEARANIDNSGIAITLGTGAGQNGPSLYGFSLPMLNRLAEYGLIHSEFGFRVSLNISSITNTTLVAPLRVGTRLYGLVGETSEIIDKARFSGPMLTSTGLQLYDVIPHVQNAQYVADLTAHLS